MASPDENVAVLASLVECDVTTARGALALANGNMCAAVAIIFDKLTDAGAQPVLVIADDEAPHSVDCEVTKARGALALANGNVVAAAAIISDKLTDAVAQPIILDDDEASHPDEPIAASTEISSGIGKMSRLSKPKVRFRRKSFDLSVATPPLPTGVIRTRERNFKAHLNIEGIGIVLPNALQDFKMALRNRKAMEQVRRQVCDALTDTAHTAEEFVGAMRRAIACVRENDSTLAHWKYFAELRGSECHKASRVKTSKSLDRILQGWLSLRQDLGITSVVCVERECVEAGRAKANQLAKQTLDQIPSDGYPSDDVALAVLRLWGFGRNTSRQNVLPDGKEWVHSDSLGLIVARGAKAPTISRATVGHLEVFQLIARWVRGRLPAAMREHSMPFTTITINKNYAARRHRDKRNEGPSIALAAGSFSGGRLRYWPGDVERGSLDKLRQGDCVELDILKMPIVFDGTCAHEVECFEGERFSVVLFTVCGYSKTELGARRQLQAAGCDWPSPAALKSLASWQPSQNSIASEGSRCPRVTLASYFRKRLPTVGDVAAPVKRSREAPDMEKTWVCPIAGCGHRLAPGTAGCCAHIAKRHRKREFETCSCRHGCGQCVPSFARDEAARILRWSITSGDVAGTVAQLGALLPFDGIHAKSVADNRQEFARIALLEKLPEDRRAFCSRVKASLPLGIPLSVDARHLQAIICGFVA